MRKNVKEVNEKGMRRFNKGLEKSEEEGKEKGIEKSRVKS